MRKKAGKITLDPSHPAHSLFELLPSGWRYRALNDQTQKQFLPSGNPSHEHLEHTTLLYYYLFTTHTYIFFTNLHMSELYTHNCLYWILCFCYFVHCLFVYLYIVIFVVCVLSCCSHSVAPWHFCYYNKFLVCVNIPGQYILILLFYLIITEYKPFTSIQSTDIYFTVIIVRVPNTFLHEVLHVVFKHLVFVAIDIFSCCIVCRTRSAQNS